MVSINTREHTSSNEEQFWLPQKEKLLRNAISLLLLAKEPIRMRHLYEMIVTSPVNIEQTRREEWHKSSYLFQLFARADRARNHSEWPLLENYWMYERPTMDARTRSNVDAEFTGMFDPLTSGKIRELLITTTNITPEDILNGRVVVIDIPVFKYRQGVQFTALFW